jgi:multidrug resistance efflux pump
VKKGFMGESQVKKTRLEIAKAEAALAKLGAPRALDPRRAALEEIIRKAEEIVAKTADGVKKGIVPQQELLNVQMKVLDYKLRLAELEDRPAAAPRSEPPQADLGRRPGDAESRAALIALKETELSEAERLLKLNAISQEEVRRLKIDLARLKAEAATAAGDYPAAVGLYEGVVTEWEATVAGTKRLTERGTLAQAELRSAEVALAEAKVEALKAAVRRQLADILRVREKELAEAKTLFEAKVIPAEEVRKAEQALNAARLRLAEER